MLNARFSKPQTGRMAACVTRHSRHPSSVAAYVVRLCVYVCDCVLGRKKNQATRSCIDRQGRLEKLESA